MWVLKDKVIYIWKLKLAFLRNHLANQSQILYVSFQELGNEIYWHDGGHITKMAAMPIYGKNPSKIFLSGTSGLISTKLGMSHWWLLLIIVCSNDDRRLTLTYFTARSNLVTYDRLMYRKKWKLLIFQNFCSLWPETNWDNEDMWVLKVKVISWPWPKVIYIWKLKLAFLCNDWAILNQILFCAWPKYQVSVSQDHWSSGCSISWECMDGILIKFCIHFIIDKIYVAIVKRHFLQICNGVTALDWYQILVFAQYLDKRWTEFNQIL